MSKGERQPIEIGFPVKGFDENWPFRAQPPGTTPDALNVRPYDAIAQRLRGGQRGGTSKYIATQPNGSLPIQMLYQEPVASSGFVESFAYADGTNFDSVGSPWRHYALDSISVANAWKPGIPSGGLKLATWTTGTDYGLGDSVLKTGVLYRCIMAHTSGAGHPTPPGNTTNWAVDAAAWAAGHNYAIGDRVVDTSVVYASKTAHTSTTGGLHPKPSTPNTTDWALAVPEWDTAKKYLAGDQVVESGVYYVCITDHTSGVFAVDLAVPLWVIYVPLVNPGRVQTGAYDLVSVVSPFYSRPNPPTAHVYQRETPTEDMTVGITITQPVPDSVNEAPAVGLFLRAGDTGDTSYYVLYYGATSTSPPTVQIGDSLGNIYLAASPNGYPQPWSPSPSGAAPGQVTRNTPVRLVASIIGNHFKAYLNSVLVGQADELVHSTLRKAGFFASALL
jgi:hypothetical protein